MFLPSRFYIGGGGMLPGVTKEQITKAKAWDLLSYLEAHDPQELKRCGPREYCTRTHDSLKISNGKWYWNSRGIGGRTALDYLIKVRGMDFVDAVEALSGCRAPPSQEGLSQSLQGPLRSRRQAVIPLPWWPTCKTGVSTRS